MKRCLIITLYWPPAGGPGVQRWLKFVRYLREFGWEPIVFTPENPETPAKDASLLEEVPDGITVLKIPIREPYRWYRSLTGRKGGADIGFTNSGQSSGFADKLIRWIRGNLFIPDARKSWVKPAVGFLCQYLKEHPADVLISTGPPHSMHLIGKQVKDKTGLPWVADFRDPWTGIDFYDDLMLSSWADKKHHRLERQVLESADFVVTVSGHIKKELENKGANRVEVITNGFDEADFSGTTQEPDNGFIITHAGSLIPSRNPHTFWKVLGKLIKAKADFSNNVTIRLIGKTDIGVKASIEENGLEPYVEFSEYLSHSEMIEMLYRSQVLLLLINKTRNAEGFLTGKLFEYLAVGRSILCIGPPQGEAAQLLNTTKAGTCIDFDDETNLQKTISSLYKEWKKQGSIPMNTKNISSYSRRNLTKQLAVVLDSVG